MNIPVHLRTFVARQLPPGRIFIFSFAAVILAGAFLLWLPFSAGRGQLTFVDALFTSASAVCVTGLVTIDIGTDLSFTGQVISLFLFQIGGLGIVTFSVVFFGMMGRGVSFKEREIVQSSIPAYAAAGFSSSLPNGSFLSTFLIEGMGTLLLVCPFFS